jgi:hypothetical protein
VWLWLWISGIVAVAVAAWQWLRGSGCWGGCGNVAGWLGGSGSADGSGGGWVAVWTGGSGSVAECRCVRVAECQCGSPFFSTIIGYSHFVFYIQNSRPGPNFPSKKPLRCFFHVFFTNKPLFFHIFYIKKLPSESGFEKADTAECVSVSVAELAL